MRVSVRNFRGCERADLELDYLTVVAGRNRQGKSSLLHAVAAALTGRPLTVTDIKKSEAAALVKAGADRALVIIENGDAGIQLEWPKCAATQKGDPADVPQASPVAVGFQRLTDMSRDDLTAFLSDLLHAAPTRDDLARKLAEVGLKDEKGVDRDGNETPSPIDTIWGRVTQEGWDAAERFYAKRRAELKGRWEAVTGERWGIAKGEQYMPPDWTSDLEGVSLEQLEADLAAARRTLERAIGEQALADAELARLREQAAQVNALQVELQRLEEEVNAAYDAHNAVVIKARPVMPSDPIACPHCEQPITVHQGVDGIRLEKGARLTKADREKVLAAQKAYDEERAAAKRALDDAVARRNDVKQLLTEARHAQTKLQSMGGRHGTAQAVEKAREGVRTAEVRYRAQQTKHAADTTHRAILQNEAIVAALGKGGLRLEKLSKALLAFNERAHKLCRAAGWQDVTVDPDMSIRYAGRAYRFLARSEKWCVNAVLALAVAEHDGSWLAILDDADDLDGPGREQLFAMLEGYELPVLVGMWANGPDKVPDLAKLGLGQTVWLKDGVATLLAHAQEAA